MKKRSLVLLLALAVAAFFAHSPNAIHLVRERLCGTYDPIKQNDRFMRAQGLPLKPANQSDFAEPTVVDGTLSRLGGNASAYEADPVSQMDQTARAVAEVSDGELRQALERSLHDDSSSDYRELLQRRWAEINPSAAAVWASALSDRATAIPAVRQSAIVWANKDLPAAVQWVDSLAPGEVRATAIIALGYEAARSVSFGAFNLVAGLDPSLERDALLEHIVRQWSVSEPNQAVEWVKQIANTPLRQQLLGDVAITAAEQDPAAAAALVSAQVPPGPNQNRAAVAIVQRWAETDPEAASDWVKEFPESDTKAAAQAALSAQIAF